jgi:hypothetical protein
MLSKRHLGGKKKNKAARAEERRMAEMMEMSRAGQGGTPSLPGSIRRMYACPRHTSPVTLSTPPVPWVHYATRAALILCGALLLLGCASVHTASVVHVNGAPGAETLAADVLDTRTGSTYTGMLSIATFGTGPTTPENMPAVVHTDAGSLSVDAVWTSPGATQKRQLNTVSKVVDKSP